MAECVDDRQILHEHGDPGWLDRERGLAGRVRRVTRVARAARTTAPAVRSAHRNGLAPYG